MAVWHIRPTPAKIQISTLSKVGGHDLPLFGQLPPKFKSRPSQKWEVMTSHFSADSRQNSNLDPLKSGCIVLLFICLSLLIVCLRAHCNCGVGKHVQCGLAGHASRTCSREGCARARACCARVRVEREGVERGAAQEWMGALVSLIICVFPSSHLPVFPSSRLPVFPSSTQPLCGKAPKRAASVRPSVHACCPPLALSGRAFADCCVHEAVWLLLCLLSAHSTAGLAATCKKQS